MPNRADAIPDIDESRALIDLVNRIFVAADAKDWDTYRSLMLDQVYVDFAGVGPHRPGVAAADQLAESTRAALGPVAVTQHMLTNHVVTVDGDHARIEFYEQALHHHPALGDDPEVNTWILYARATRDAIRTDRGWRISAAGLTVVHQTGNQSLLADVAALGSKAPPDDPSGHPRRWWIMGVLGAVAFMATLDIYIVNVALPAISRAFDGPSLAAISWVLNAYTIVFAAVMVPAGRLADHLGRRQMLLAGIVIFTVGSAACAAAPTLSLLVTGRVIQALGAATIVPIAMSLLLPTFPPARHAAILGLWASIMAVAASTGPVVGGLLVGVGWRYLFLINVPIAVAALAVGVWCLPRIPRHAQSRPPEPLSTAGVLVAVTFVVLATVQGPDWGWTSARIVALYVVAALAAAVVVVRSLRHPYAVVESALFGNREFSSASIGLFIFFGVLSVWLLATVLLLEGVWHYGTVRVGFAILPGPAMAAAVSINAARIGRRFGRTLPAVAGLILFGLAAIIWLSSARDHPAYATTFLPALLVAGLGSGLTQAPLLGSAGSLPPARFATGSAVLNMSRQVGGAVFVAVLVALAGGSALPQSIAPVRRGWVLMAAAALAGAAVLAGMRMRRRLPEAQRTAFG